MLPIGCHEKARKGALKRRKPERFFDGMVFAFAGRFKVEMGEMKRMVDKGGGICAASVTLKVTHVITTKAAVDSEKRSTAIATAIGRRLVLLHEDFLTRCVEEGELLNLQEFRLGAEIVERQARCDARPEASSASVSVLHPRESHPRELSFSRALEKGGRAVSMARELLKSTANMAQSTALVRANTHSHPQVLYPPLERVPFAPFPCNSISNNQGWGSLADDSSNLVMVAEERSLGSQEEIEDDFVKITGAC